MITNMLINALGQAIFESCGQALLIYVVLQLFMQLFPGIGSKYRYDVNYLGLSIICCWFMVNLAKIYMHNAAMPNYSPMLYNSAVAYGTPKQLPTLLQQSEAFITTYAKYITGLYLIGLVLHAFRLLGGFMHIAHIRKQKNLVENSFWAAKADGLAKKLRMFKNVGLYFSEHVQIPLTLGHIKPIIVFPLALINNLEAEQVEAILLHELAHIKRCDYLMNIVQCVMKTILCFNPFVWLISKTIRQEREFCCDDMVVDEDCDNYAYSRALLIIAQQNNQVYPLAMASTGTTKYPLFNRIKRLNTMKTQDSLPKFHLLIIVAIVSIGILLAWGLPQYSVAKATRYHNKAKAAHRFNKLNSFIAPPVAPVPPSITPAPKIKLVIYADTATGKYIADTLKPKKNKFKIVIEDDNGNKKEYNSVGDLPDSAREEFVKENPSFGRFKFMDSMKFADMDDFRMSPDYKKQMEDIRKQSAEMRKKFNSPEYKKEMEAIMKQREDIRKKFDSPEFKKQMQDIRKEREEIRKKFNSPKYKKQAEDMQIQAEKMSKQFNSPEWKKQVEDMQLQAGKISEQFNSPEWKKQVEAMQIQAEKVGRQFNSPEWKKQVEKMSKQFNSPEWKKQVEKMSKQFNSPEWKKQMEDMQKDMEKGLDNDMKKDDADTAKSAN
jgi:bla regulator protein BlaR1